jgi:hypothetical protein
MPAPQASAMQQLARLKFTSFNIKVPQNWKDPQGDAANHYGRAFKPDEKASSPGMPPLVQPASLNKYHTDTQKMHIGKIGKFIDDTCSAICGAWGQWQTMTSGAAFVVVGPVVSVGQFIGPPMGQLMMANGAPMSSPNEMKYTNVISTVIGTQWEAFVATIKCPGLPFYPAYAALPTPVAPPMPNVPFPLGQFVSATPLVSCNVMKPLMIAQLADPQAPFMSQLFESICTGFEQCFTIWNKATLVTNVMAIATGGTPISPLPAAGTATMPPGGLV